MNVLNDAVLPELIAAQQAPCLSLYQPTHRTHPANAQDHIRFGNLVKQLEESLALKYPNGKAAELLKPFKALVDDNAFWKYNLDGLAVFAAPGFFKVVRVQRPVPELVVAADSFHLKPIRRALQTVDRFHVLGLTMDRIVLFEGNRDALDELKPAEGVPVNITDALGEELTEKHQTVSNYGGRGSRMGGPGEMRHGHGGKSDEVGKDTERFFRAVDRAVMEHHTKPSGHSLVLAALPEHQSVFRGVSHNNRLLEEVVAVDPTGVDPDKLRRLVWEAVEPRYHAHVRELVEQFGTAKAQGLGSDDLMDVAEAAAAGRVATLLVDADQAIAGRLDTATGKVIFDSLLDPRVDDLLDDLSELVAERGGTVMVVPGEVMPVKTGVAATYRY
jgi:hypothetical protein